MVASLDLADHPQALQRFRDLGHWDLFGWCFCLFAALGPTVRFA